MQNNPQQQPLQSFSTTLLLKHGRSNTSPIRTMTNGSIMQNHSMINMNRMYNSLPGHTTATTTTTNGNGNGEVNGNNVTSPPNGAPPFEVRTLAMIRAQWYLSSSVSDSRDVIHCQSDVESKCSIIEHPVSVAITDDDCVFAGSIALWLPPGPGLPPSLL